MNEKALIILIIALVVFCSLVIMKLNMAIKEIEIARVRIITSTDKLNKVKDEVIKEFKYEVKKEMFNLALLNIRVK